MRYQLTKCIGWHLQLALQRLDAFIEGYIIYPNDRRFVEGINSSAQSLLGWAENMHRQGNHEVALDRAMSVLEVPALPLQLRQRANELKTNAEQAMRN